MRAKTVEGKQRGGGGERERERRQTGLAHLPSRTQRRGAPRRTQKTGPTEPLAAARRRRRACPSGTAAPPGFRRTAASQGAHCRACASVAPRFHSRAGGRAPDPPASNAARPGCVVVLVEANAVLVEASRRSNGDTCSHLLIVFIVAVASSPSTRRWPSSAVSSSRSAATGLPMSAYVPARLLMADRVAGWSPP